MVDTPLSSVRLFFGDVVGESFMPKRLDNSGRHARNDEFDGGSCRPKKRATETIPQHSSCIALRPFLLLLTRSNR